MAANVGEMSPDELKEIIGSVVEQKLKDILGDPDEEFEIRADVRDRLLRQKKAVAQWRAGRRVGRDYKAAGNSLEVRGFDFDRILWFDRMVTLC
jgi:hypothetical protein